MIYNLAYTYKFQLKTTQVSQEIWLTETTQFDSYHYENKPTKKIRPTDIQ